MALNDTYNDAGLGPEIPKLRKVHAKVDAFGEPLEKNAGVIAALAAGAAEETRHPLATGNRVKHRKSQMRGTVRHHNPNFSGRNIAVSWSDGSIGMHSADELCPDSD